MRYETVEDMPREVRCGRIWLDDVAQVGCVTGFDTDEGWVRRLVLDGGYARADPRNPGSLLTEIAHGVVRVELAA